MESMNNKLTHEYIRGLVDGEGCFTFCKNKTSLGSYENIPTFSIGMNERDLPLLEKLRDSLGVKNRVYLFSNILGDRRRRGRKAFLIIRDVGALRSKIVPIFHGKLHGYKGVQFFDWIHRIGDDENVPDRYKIIHRLHKSSFYYTSCHLISDKNYCHVCR